MQQQRRSSQPQQEYVVRSGDNPYVIAKSNGVALQRLLEANGLNQNSIIHPGDVLQIPGQGSEQGAAQPQQRPQNYTVRPGDSLWGISDRLGISMTSLMRMNNLTRSSVIHPNQTLQLPGNVSPQSAQQAARPSASAPQNTQQASQSQNQSQEQTREPEKEKPQPEATGHKGYDPVLGKALAAASMRETRGRTRSESDCYKYVANAVDAVIGRFLTGMHAYMAASQLAARPHLFTETSAGNLTGLPAGAIVVWGKGTTKSGHISIAQGNGMETSDFIGRQMTYHYGGAGARVFLPKARM